MKLFSLNKTPTGYSIEWKLMEGGYAALTRWKVRLSHRFARWGRFDMGSEKQFFVRFEAGLDHEPWVSWLGFEAINPFEARWFYFRIRCWKQTNFQVTFNFGPTLTLQSREYLKRAYYARAAHKAKVADQIQKEQGNINGGGKNQWLNLKRSLTAR